jgi:hypothetical protein
MSRSQQGRNINDKYSHMQNRSDGIVVTAVNVQSAQTKTGLHKQTRLSVVEGKNLIRY